MKLFYKIVIAFILIFGLSLYIAKKSIDYTFKKVECTQTDADLLTAHHLRSFEV